MSSPPTYKRLDADNVLFLFIDHQAGLINCVRDYSEDEFKNGMVALANMVKYYKAPVILTTSFDQGPNGPISSLIRDVFPDAPLIRRPGEINAMDNPDFARLVKDSGKKQIVISGILTEICVAFPALTLIEQGYDVFVATDASGTYSLSTRESAHKRMAAAGVQLLNWAAVAGEMQRDWRRDIEGYGQLMATYSPISNALTELFNSGYAQGKASK